MATYKIILSWRKPENRSLLGLKETQKENCVINYKGTRMVKDGEEITNEKPEKFSLNFSRRVNCDKAPSYRCIMSVCEC